MRFRTTLLLLAATAALTAATDWTAAGKAWWAHIEFLADDKQEGRNVGSKGYEASADYVTNQFEKAGLAPGNGSSYSQPVEFAQVTLDEPKSSLAIVRAGK